VGQGGMNRRGSIATDALGDGRITEVRIDDEIPPIGGITRGKQVFSVRQ